MVVRKRDVFGNLKLAARATVFPFDSVRSKREFVLVYLARLVFLVGRRLWWDNCPQQAAALAYQTMLSLVPLVAVGVSFASALKLDEYQQRLVEFLDSHLLPEAARSVVGYVMEMGSAVHLKTLGIVGGVGLLLLALTLLFSVEKTVNQVFRCERSPLILVRVITAIAVLVFAPVAFGVSLYLTTEALVLAGWLSTIVPVLLSSLALFLCYWLLPHTKVRLLYSAVSAVTAGGLLEVLKLGFAVYASYLGQTLSYVYGAFAILPLAMVWVYLAWMVVLFGAELSAALHEVVRHDHLNGSEGIR